jgi:hypothetical protein
VDERENEAPQLGDRLQLEEGTDAFPLALSPTVDARNAAAMTLAALLKRVRFRTAPGSDGQGTDFQLNDVLTEWPESFEELDYPVAVVTGVDEPLEDHSLTPTALDETLDQYCPGTVLWKTHELQQTFQVDFWTTNKAEREAIAARLPDVFNPGEARSGVMVRGPVEYFDLPVRLTFLGATRPDTGQSVYNRERELRARIMADLDVVHLRKGVPLSGQPLINGEPVSPKQLEPLAST